MLTPKAGNRLASLFNSSFWTLNDLFVTSVENELLKNLPVETQCTNKEADLVKYIYATKLSRVNLKNVEQTI